MTDQQLYDQYKPTVTGIVKRFTQRRNLRLSPDLVDDLKQVAIERYIRAIKEFDPSRGTRATSYAYRMVVYSLQDVLRGEDPLTRGHRKKVKSGEAMPIKIFDVEDSAVTSIPDECGSISLDESIDLEMAIEQLPALERAVIRLKMDGLTLKMIAEEVVTLHLAETCTPQNAYYLHDTAVKKLKKLLSE